MDDRISGGTFSFRRSLGGLIVKYLSVHHYQSSCLWNICLFIIINPVFIRCYLRQRRWPELFPFKYPNTFLPLGSVRSIFSFTFRFDVFFGCPLLRQSSLPFLKDCLLMLLTHAQTIAVRLPLLMMPNFKLLTKVRLNPKNAWKKCLHLIQTKCRNFAQTSIDLKALMIWRWYQRFFTFEIRDFCPLCMYFIHLYVLVLYSYWSAIIV